MVIKNLLRRKTRTLLTIISISIGVAAIIGLGVLAEGLESGYSSMLTGSKADLVISQPNSFDVSMSSIDESIGDQLAVMPEVEAISGMLQGWTQTEGEPFFFVFGYPKDSFLLGRFQIVDGVPLDSREAQESRGKPLLLGSAAAEVMDKQIGDTMRLMDSVYRIVGIFETGDAFEDSAAILDLPDAQAVIGKQRQVSLFYIQLKDPSLGERLINRIQRRYTDISISGLQEFADKQIMDEMVQAYVWVIGGLAILIGGVGMMNAQLMSVFERTREIGVLRAVGWSSTRVLRMILAESLLVSLLGGLLGVGIGWLMLYAISQKTVMLGLATTDISNTILIQAFILVLILGLVGGYYPARRAAKLQPVTALQYEGGSSGSKVKRLPFGGLAVQSLWQRSLRTLLTLGTIGLTVGSILALDSIMGGLQDSMSEMFSDTEIMLRQADISDTSLSAMDERIGKKLAAWPEIQSVSGVIFTAFMLPEEGAFFILLGYPPNEYAVQQYDIVEGERLTANRQVILGRMMADMLNKDVGDTVELSGSRFRIVGIFESTTAIEEMGGVTTLRDAQVLAGYPHKVTIYAVKLQDPSQAPEVVAKITDQFPEVHAALSGEFTEQMPDFETSEAMINAISLMAIFIGGIGVLNTMLMAVYERTREIGVLRSLGWRRRAILGMILREATLLGLLGGATGVFIALGMNYLISLIPSYGEMITPVWELQMLARAIGVALLLGVLGGLYPAYRATRLQPVEALRYE
jgi:ABC-type antimicrobial peptide transport system permease subunit